MSKIFSTCLGSTKAFPSSTILTAFITDIQVAIFLASYSYALKKYFIRSSDLGDDSSPKVFSSSENPKNNSYFSELFSYLITLINIKHCLQVASTFIHEDCVLTK